MGPENIKNNKEEITGSSKKRPTGVTILAVLVYINVAIILFLCIAFLLGGAGWFLSPVSLTSLINFLPTPINEFISQVIGVILLLFAVMGFFITRGLWNGKNSARIIVLIFSVLGILISVMPLSIVNLVINGVIIWYLGFNETAKEYFRNNQ